MGRNRSILVALVLGLVAAVGVAGSAADAEAKGKKAKKSKKAKKKAEPAAKAADTRAIGELMGGFEFGMSSDKVLKIIYARIDEKYKERIAATTDVYQQDQLRQTAKKEKAKIKKSFIKFNGQKSGWDVSIIDEEFSHNNDESMLVYWERDDERGTEQRRFFFFVDGELYKMYIAFDAKMFPPEKRKFAYFHEIMETRYGAGDLVFVDDAYGDQQIKHLFWKDGTYYLRAINRMEFYGTFCLAISSSKVETWLADRRAERNPNSGKDNAIIDSMTEGEDDETSLGESNSNVVDSIIHGK